MGYQTPYAPTRSELSSCIQCGLCLPHCPTFRLTGKETDSPRGRLTAMTAVLEGITEIDEVFSETISFCLGCRACEPVCPSMVPYGRTLEGARAEISAQQEGVTRRLRGWIMETWLGSPATMKVITWATALIQHTGLARIAPLRFRAGLRGLRRIRWRTPSLRGRIFEPDRAPVATVGLLTGCIMGHWFGDVHQASIALLVRAGYRVVVPSGQTCCGALAAHDGAADGARRLAFRNAAAFRGVDYIVANAAGCSAHLKDYHHWSPGEVLSDDWQVRDITELVADAVEDGRLPRLEEERGVVALQHPCHLRNAQRIITQPRVILEAAGYQTTDIDPVCCGAAGFYSFLRPDTSARLGRDKAGEIQRSGTTLVASANPGCEMQLRSHLATEYRVLHPVELYLEALSDAVESRP